MKILRQLLGRKPAPPETLESKIARLDHQSQTELETLVLGQGVDAESLELRKAALSRIPYGAALRDVASVGGVPSELEKGARERISTFIDDASVSKDTLLKEVSNTEALLAIAASCSKVDFESDVLNSIKDQKELADVCLVSHSARVRQNLAHRIEEPDLLRELAKGLKSKDKKAYKTVKSKLDQIKEEEHKRAEINIAIQELCLEAEQQIERHIDKEYLHRVERLHRKWKDVGDQAEADITARFNNAIDKCQANIEQYQAELKAQAEHEEQLSELDSNRKILLSQLSNLMTEIYAIEKANEENLTSIHEKLDTYKNQWHELKQLGKPHQKSVKTYTQTCEAIETLLKDYAEVGGIVECLQRIEEKESTEVRSEVKCLRRLLHPMHSIENMEPCETVKAAITKIESIDADYANYQENRQKNIRMLGGLIRKADQACGQGRLKQAIGMRHSVDEKLEQLDNVPANILRQIESLDETIQKLVDWQSYAVVPKKEALIANMEKLVGSDIPAEALATRIKKLQDEWKGLSQSGKDRNEDLWLRFSELADKAYEPCKSYYKELSEERKENLGKRKTLVKQLEDFYSAYDWEKADWKYVEQIIRTARPELHAYAPVDRSANKPVLQAFDSAMDAIQAKLTDELDKNKAAKEQLIQQAAKLPEVSDTQQAIDSAKRLQSQWKLIGRCHYKENDRLWKEFRVHCDAVFAKKDKEVAERRAEAHEHIAGANAIIDKIKGFLNLPPEDLLATRSEKEALQIEFSNIEGIPEKPQRAIERDLAKAVDKYENSIADVLRDNDLLAWKSFFDIAEKMNAYKLKLASGADKEVELAEFNSIIANVEQWPEGGHAAIKQALDKPLMQQAEEENLKALKTLCIRAEILTDKESPAADKALRMEYQVSLLKQGMGQVQRAASSQELAIEWLLAEAVEENTYNTLFERFYASWKAL